MIRTPNPRVRLCLAGAALIAAALTAEASTAFASSEDVRMDEYRVRAAFLMKFTKFVQWPHEGTLSFCITGDDEFGAAMTSTSGAADIAGVRAEVRNVAAKGGDFSKCDVVYLGRNAIRFTGDILKQIDHLPILAVGESETFVNEGGIVRVFVEDRKIRFQVNGATAEKRGLKISSQLLSLAAR